MAHPLDNRRAPWVVIGAITCLYLGTASRWLAQADSPEFAALFALGGVAHPPGYPTVTLFYRALSWVPAPGPWAAGLATALVGAAAVAIAYRAALAWGARQRAALVAVLLVGLNTQVWLVHTHPEAFVFNNLFAAGILWLAAPRGPLRGTARVVGLGLTAGLGLGAHHSIIFLAPLGFWGVVSGAREADRGAVALGAGVFALAAGLSVYGYLLVAPESVSFGRIDGWDALLHHFLRSDYGTTQLGASGQAAPVEQLVFWIAETVSDAVLIGVLMFLIGVARVFGRESESDAVPHRRAWWMLFGAWLLSGPVFVMMFNRPPEGLTYEIVKRFHVLPVIVGVPFVACGARRYFELKISGRLRAVIGLAILAMLILSGVLRTRRAYDSTIQDYVENTLHSVPENAVVLGQGDHRYFGFQYLQQVDVLRRDVVFIEPLVLGLDWYVDRTRRRLAVAIPYATPRPDGGRRVELRAILDMLLEETDREIFVTRDFAADILNDYPMEPWGAGWRLLRPDDEPSSPRVLAETNAEIYEGFVHRSDAPVYVENRWGWSLWNTYTRVWDDVAARCGDDTACLEIAEAHLDRYPDL